MIRRIIHIDDEPVYAKLLSAMASALGSPFEITHETSGQAAIERLRADPTGVLVLLDLRMPEMDGYQVLDAIRADRRLAHIPVIILTGESDLGAQRKANDGGATSFLAKPMTKDGFDALFRTVDSMWPYLVEPPAA